MHSPRVAGSPYENRAYVQEMELKVERLKSVLIPFESLTPDSHNSAPRWFLLLNKIRFSALSYDKKMCILPPSLR